MDHAQLLKVILNRHFGVEPERVTPETKFEDDLGMDDVEQSELQELVEKEFKVEFTPYQVDTMATVQDYLDAIAVRSKVE